MVNPIRLSPTPKSRFTTAAALAILTACGVRPGLGTGEATPAIEATTTSSATKPEASRVAPSREPNEQRLAAVDRMLAVMSRLRKLPIKGHVTGKVIGRDEMVRRMKALLVRDVPEQDIVGEQAALTALGLLPRRFDYVAAVMRLLDSQLAGYYDPKEKTLFLMADLGASGSDTILAHELVHALQDQNFDLVRLTDHRNRNADELGAIHSLAEGDATSAMLDYSLRPEGRSSFDISPTQFRLIAEAGIVVSPELASEPPILVQSLLAPYVDGFRLVTEVRKTSGWAGVDELWRHPPTTTEQVLHLDKLASREPALAVPVPQVPANVSAALHPRGSVQHFGEQGLRLVLAQWLPRRLAVQAAAGWGGDSAQAFVDEGGNPWVGWRVKFDEAPKARGEARFAEATQCWKALLGSSSLKKVAPAVTTRRSSSACWSIHGGRGALVLVQRDLELFFAGVPVTDGRGLATSCRLGSRWAHRELQRVEVTATDHE